MKYSACNTGIPMIILAKLTKSFSTKKELKKVPIHDLYFYARCSGVVTEETKAKVEETKKLVSTITTSSTKTATSKKKLSDKQRAMAAKVRLMKLKGTAKGNL